MGPQQTMPGPNRFGGPPQNMGPGGQMPPQGQMEQMADFPPDMQDLMSPGFAGMGGMPPGGPGQPQYFDENMSWPKDALKNARRGKKRKWNASDFVFVHALKKKF